MSRRPSAEEPDGGKLALSSRRGGEARRWRSQEALSGHGGARCAGADMMLSICLQQQKQQQISNTHTAAAATVAAAEASLGRAELQQLQCLLALHALCAADVGVLVQAHGGAAYFARGVAPYFKAGALIVWSCTDTRKSSCTSQVD
eukprot:scaffold17562_cov23-Tisochrysis_lutea.AAC.1